MHYALAIFVIIWFVFLAPIRVVVITATACFLIAASVKAIASAISGMQITYGASIKAVFLSMFFLLVTMLLIGGSFTHFSLSNIVVLNPVVIVGSLLGAYILGYHLCLGTSFGASILIAVLSTIASAAIVLGIRAVV